MAAMVKRLSQGVVVPLLRVRFPLAAPQKNLSNREVFLLINRNRTGNGKEESPLPANVDHISI